MKGLGLSVPRIVIITVSLTFLLLFGNLSGGLNDLSLKFYATEILTISVGAYSILLFLMNTTSGVIRVPTGLLIDRHGTKRYLTIAYGISVVGLVIPLVWKDFLGLAVAMVLSGAGTGIMFCSQKFRLAHLTDPRNRSAAYSLLFVSSFLASSLGQFISGALYQNYGFYLPTLVSLAIITIGMFLSLKLPSIGEKDDPRDDPKNDLKTTAMTVSSGQESKGVSSGLKQMGRSVWLITLYKTTFNALGGATGFIYSLYLRNTFQLSYELTGTIMALLSIPNLVGIILAGRAHTTEGRKKILLLVATNIPLFFIGFRLVSDLIQAIALITIINLIHGNITPTMDAVLADSARSSRVGISFGIYDMSMRIGIGVGNTFGGYLVDNFGYVTALSTAGLLATIPSFIAFSLLKIKNASK